MLFPNKIGSKVRRTHFGSSKCGSWYCILFALGLALVHLYTLRKRETDSLSSVNLHES